MSASTEKSSSAPLLGSQTPPESRSVSVPTRVFNYGKVKKSQIKKLKNGHGKMLEEIKQIVSSHLSKLPDAGPGKVYQPVVTVVRRKQSNKEVKILGATIDTKKLKKAGIRL